MSWILFGSFYLISLSLLFGSFFKNFELRILKFKIISGKENDIFQKELVAYQFALNCLSNTNASRILNKIFYHTMHERKQHLDQLNSFLDNYINYKSYCSYEYCGPWIEEWWRNSFINKSIDSFGIFVPIFVQWTSIFVNYQFSKPKHYSTFHSIFKKLRNDFIYITIVNTDYGLEYSHSFWDKVPPNILILSSGGAGHIPIPFMKIPLQNVSLLPFKRKFVFLGSLKNHPTRQIIAEWFMKNYPISSNFSYSTSWIDPFRESEIIISPRGHGRGCYRTYEIIQLGMILFYIHDGIPWLPYFHSTLEWDKIAFISSFHELDQMKIKIDSVTTQQLEQMRKQVSNITILIFLI